MSTVQPPAAAGTSSATASRQAQSASSATPVPAPSTLRVDLSPTAHLDPACYVKGTHPLTIGANTILHPRCRLYTDQGPITIGQDCVLNERCILGVDKDLNPQMGVAAPASSSAATDSSTNTSPEIRIGAKSHLSSSVRIQPPAQIGSGALLDAGVTLAPGCVVGAHTKICAGVTLPPGTAIPEWTVVYGLNGEQRRRRQRQRHGLDGMDIAAAVEDARLDAMSRERAGVEALLKMNASKNLSAAGGSARKRDSVLVSRSDGHKG